MKLCLKILAIAIVAAATFSMISCSAPQTFNYQNGNIQLAVTFCGNCNYLTYDPLPYPQPVTLPNQQAQLLVPGTIVQVPQQGGSQSGCVEFTATLSNLPPNTTLNWTIYPTPNATIPPSLPTGGTPVPSQGTGIPTAQSNNNTNIGTLNDATGLTNFWCIPNLLPIYTGAALTSAEEAPEPPGWYSGPGGFPWTGVPQGMVEVVASASIDPTNPNGCAVLTSSTCAYSVAMFQVYVISPNAAKVVLFPSNTSTVTNVATVSHLAPNNTFQFSGVVIGTPPCTATLPAAPATPVTCVLTGGGQAPANYTDNSVIWQIAPSTSTTTILYCSTGNAGIAGCPAANANNTSLGTISTTGLYTAPSTALTAPQPVIIAVAHSNTAVSVSANITVN